MEHVLQSFEGGGVLLSAASADTGCFRTYVRDRIRRHTSGNHRE